MNQALAAAAFALWWALSPFPTLAHNYVEPPKSHTEGQKENVINDVTGINPVLVDTVIEPHTVSEIQEAVKNHPGPVSIGGGRFSMGGQTATAAALFLDMRHFNRILAFDPENKTITVEPGITWRMIQEHIDPSNLSVSIMQSYNNFTVGGSLSVNVHGRYMGLGPLVLSVRSIKVVLADGSLVEATPTQNTDIFYSAIGGYGGIGVIVEATLALADNDKVERESVVMPVSEYLEYFKRAVRQSTSTVFHNADIYPNRYDTVRVVNWNKTQKEVTVPERIMPQDQASPVQRVVLHIITEMPGGKWLREHLFDPIQYRDEAVVYRNYEASYDVSSLEPASREKSTYVLQEYFVPIDQFDVFVPKMRDILVRNNANLVNVSIRHALPDTGTKLAWAREEVFAFVLYYKQGTSEADKAHVANWTRELIDAAIETGGTYYLPYQIHATQEQFQKAYPGFEEFFAIKRRVDPTNKFRNKLWDAYYPSGAAAARATSTAPDPKYDRPEELTYLTFPEWYIVYSAREYAKHLMEGGRPSAFPYFEAIRQFWDGYAAVQAYAQKRGLPENPDAKLMINVIGASFTAEYALKALYEKTVGRATELLSLGMLAAEDRYAAAVALEYAQFLDLVPWYEFPFFEKFAGLWTEVSPVGPHAIRKWERRLALSQEYLVKGAYGLAIKQATKAAYAPPDLTIHVLLSGTTSPAVADPRIEVLPSPQEGTSLMRIPRYAPFTEIVTAVANNGSDFAEVAGNRMIFVTVLAPPEWEPATESDGVFAMPVVIDPAIMRKGYAVPVAELGNFIRKRGDARIEHIYDY